MDTGRAEYHAITDQQALDALQLVSKLEGIIPALETSHAFAYLQVHPCSCPVLQGCAASRGAALQLRQPASCVAARTRAPVQLGPRVSARVRGQELCPTLPDGTRIVINLSGRGDKDVQTVAKAIEAQHHEAVRLSD